MSRATTHGKTNPAVRWSIGIALLGIAAGLFAGGHLMSQHHTEATPVKNTPYSPHALRIAGDNLFLTGSLFQLPLRSQESLFVWVCWEDGSALQYGTGWLAERIEEWRKKDLFGDATHAKWLVRKSQQHADKENFSRLIFSEQSLPVNLTDGAFRGCRPHKCSLAIHTGITRADTSGFLGSATGRPSGVRTTVLREFSLSSRGPLHAWGKRSPLGVADALGFDIEGGT